MNILFASIMILNIFFTVVPPQPIAVTTDCKPHYLDNYYLPAWVTNDTWYREMPQYTIGKAVWYAPGIMNATAEYRGMSLEGFKGGVATNSVSMMGKTVWLKRQGLDWEGPFLVVDVGQRNHAYHQAVNVKSIVEVDFKTAIEWGIVSYNSNAKKDYVINKWFEGNVEMWVGLKAPDWIDGKPIVYSEWYEKNAEFCDGQPNRRWKVEDWMIMNYQDYQDELDRLTPEISFSLLPYQVEQAQLLQAMAEKYIAENSMVTHKLLPPTTSVSDTLTIQEEPEIIATHTLGPNETWTHLALHYYGHMTEPYWRLIYEANIDLVGDDYHRIWGGMVVVIPALPADFSP
jgi:hypothetical protein